MNVDSHLKSTNKPLSRQTVYRRMLHCSACDEVVLNAFLGSGTTVTTGERIGRRSFGMERDPTSVDTIIRRWQEPTDGSARPGDSCRIFDDLAREAETANAI